MVVTTLITEHGQDYELMVIVCMSLSVSMVVHMRMILIMSLTTMVVLGSSSIVIIMSVILMIIKIMRNACLVRGSRRLCLLSARLLSLAFALGPGFA